MWNLTTNNPFSNLRNLQSEMNDLFGGFLINRHSFPKVNVYDLGDEIKLLAEMPGVSKDDININAVGNQLAIEVEKKSIDCSTDMQYHRKETEEGKFIRSFNLPYEINQEKITAKLKNGVLEIVLHRTEQSKPKKITVNAE